MSTVLAGKICSFGQRLKEIRIAERLNQEAFGKIGGVGVRSQSTYESGDRKPDIEYLLRLEDAGLDVSYLLTGRKDPYVQAVNDRLPVGVRPTDLTREIGDNWQQDELGDDWSLDGYVPIPVLNVEVSAGVGRYPLDQQVKCYNAWRTSYISGRGLNPANLFEVLVVGDSMEPVINDGDYVLVDTSQKSVGGGAPYVLRINDDLLVKYVQRMPGGQIQISSANSAAYPAYTVSEKDVGQHGFQIWGRVIRSARDW